ncbi:MAG: hypothetical protein ACHQRJ_21130 [Alphaproteobacteria bacterium]
MSPREGPLRALLQGARRAYRRYWHRLAERLVWLYLVAAAVAVFYLCEDEHVAVHIHWYRDNLHWLTYGQWGFGLEDFVKPFRDFESRTRFLAYFLQAIDHCLRFYLYQYTRIPTNLSIAYIPELVSVALFYKLLLNLTQDKLSARLGVAFYATSVGFTSGLSLMFIPAKSMTNVAFIVVAYVASEMWKRDKEKLFIEHPVRHQLATLATIFLAFNLDEGAFFAPVIAPVLFPSMFLRPDPTRSSFARNLLNMLVYLLPVFLFALFVLVAVPIITRATWGYSFDYIDTLLGSQDPRMQQAGYGLAGGFTLASLYRNFLALLSRCFLPSWAFSHISIGDRDPFKELYLIGIVVGLALLPMLQEASGRRLAHRSLILTGLYILFSALLNGRHTIIVDGYYYGSGIAVFVSLALALAAHAACLQGGGARRAAIVLAALPIISQIDNSVELARVNQMMYESFAVDWYRERPQEMRPFFVALDPHRGVSRWELNWIWRLWKEGKLAELRSATISPGSVYLLFELDRIDQLESGRVDSGHLGAETIHR